MIIIFHVVLDLLRLSPIYFYAPLNKDVKKGNSIIIKSIYKSRLNHN